MTEEASGNAWGQWILWVVVLVLLALTIAPVLMRQKLMGDYTKACQNAKSIGYALFNFSNDYRFYPNDRTGEELEDDPNGENYAPLSAAGGSNYYFSQLMAAGYVDQESPFYAKTGNTIEPDNDKSTDAEILKSGEVGFVYVVWDLEPHALPGQAPLMFAFLGEDMKATHLRRVMILRHDMSVDDLHPNRDGTVLHRDQDFFDESQAHWAGQKPNIVWPR